MAHSPVKLDNGGVSNPAGVTRHAPARGASFAKVMEGEGAARNKSNAAVASASSAPRGIPLVDRLPDSGGIPLNNPVLAGRMPSDLMRMQNLQKARNDIAGTRTISGLMDTLSSNSGSTLDIARNMGLARQLGMVAAAGGNGRGFSLTAADYIHTAPVQRRRPEKSGSRDYSAYSAEALGKLSAKFESGGMGISAIGYDRTGGTSYGKYQIASAVGSMANFLSYLDEQAPDLARRLRKSGPSNTGSRNGAMPDEWRAIAAEQPERFGKLQEAFIRDSHYQPALRAIIDRTGLDEKTLSNAMREVIWSTAVQHGPAGAARIFERADGLSGKPTDVDYESNMIKNVYSVRAGQFGSSTAKVQTAVRNRFHEERELALNMLKNQGGSTLT